MSKSLHILRVFTLFFCFITLTPKITPVAYAADSDRKEQNEEAKDSARQAAVVAFTMCAVLFAQAAATEDEAAKAALTIAAIQECQQGQEQLNSANENESNEEDLSEDDTTSSQSTPQQTAQQTKEDSGNDNYTPIIPTSGDPKVPEITIPTLGTKNDTKADETPLATVSKDYGGGAISEMGGASVKADDSAAPSAQDSAYNSPAVYSAAKGVTDNSTSDKKSAKDNEKGGRKSETASGSGGYDGGSSDSSKKYGDDSSSSLLSFLTPGAMGAAEAGAFGVGGHMSQLASGGTAEKGKKGANIFEIAAENYKKITYKEAKIKSRFNASIK